MSLFNFFGSKAQNEIDPYWEFNTIEHFRPELNRGEFYKLSGFDFGWFVLEPISNFIKDKEHEIDRGKSLSHGQKALYYWWYLDGQVTNGGFVQFYYNGYGVYVPTIIKGLEYVGSTEMVHLIKKADKIYQKNKDLMDKARESDLFGSDLYDKLDEMSSLDDKYYEINETTMSLLESYIRKHPNEIVLDEDGNEFDLTFTGVFETFYADKKVKEAFYLEQGVLNGFFNSFYENGKLKEQIDYKQGKQTGERKEFYANGKLQFQISKDAVKNIFRHEWYFENGNPKKLASKRIDKDENIGAFKEWYENGQLAKTGNYISNYEREGEWLEYYENGSAKVEAVFENKNFIIKNHWNEKGDHILKNGTGLYVTEYSIFGDNEERNEQEYKNYKRHGKQKTFKNGVLILYQEMENGEEHGITKNYYKNGKVKQETRYENGKSVSTQKFSKIKNPKVKTTVVSIICANCYKDYEDYQLPDNDPKPINDLELAAHFKAEVSLFQSYGDDHVMTYGYFVFVSESGTASDIKFAVADNLWLEEQVKLSMLELKFEPALRNGVAVKSIHYVRYNLELTE